MMRQVTGHKLLGRLEGLILVLLGASTGSFALFGNYSLLMNPKFMWLTAAGAVIVLFLGVAIMAAPRTRPHYSCVFAFAALAIVVIAGKPYSGNVNALVMPEAPGLDEASLVIDGRSYMPMDLPGLYQTLERKDENLVIRPFVAIGVMKQNPELAGGDRFALVRPIMFCCAADAIMVGFLCEPNGEVALADQWVTVYGSLRKLDGPVTVPNIRHGAVRFTLMCKDHVIETIRVVPYEGFKPTKDIMEELSSDRFSLFARAIEAAGLNDTLKGEGPFTVFAPIDQAFHALPGENLDTLFEPANLDRLKSLVQGHVAEGRYLEKDLATLNTITTLTGVDITIRVRNGRYFVGGARILFGNLAASNGVIHAIHPVLLPDDK
ncbi:MAG: fasciclin domain-containing protein [Planctomycetota bacterium]|jgi:uncharacterized surface protein with fasciclin (FAS1) repeats